MPQTQFSHFLFKSPPHYLFPKSVLVSKPPFHWGPIILSVFGSRIHLFLFFFLFLSFHLTSFSSTFIISSFFSFDHSPYQPVSDIQPHCLHTCVVCHPECTWIGRVVFESCGVKWSRDEIGGPWSALFIFKVRIEAKV